MGRLGGESRQVAQDDLVRAAVRGHAPPEPRLGRGQGDRTALTPDTAGRHVGERCVADLFDGVDLVATSRLIASWQLLHGPAVPVRVAEEDERTPVELLDLADLHPALGKLFTRGVYVRDDQLKALYGTRLRLRDPSS